jgi:hypothetical protein
MLDAILTSHGAVSQTSLWKAHGSDEAKRHRSSSKRVRSGLARNHLEHFHWRVEYLDRRWLQRPKLEVALAYIRRRISYRRDFLWRTSASVSARIRKSKE